MTGLSKAALIAAIAIVINPAVAKDGGKQAGPKQSGAVADKNTKATSKDTKKKNDAIIDFIRKQGEINPQIIK